LACHAGLSNAAKDAKLLSKLYSNRVDNRLQILILIIGRENGCNLLANHNRSFENLQNLIVFVVYTFVFNSIMSTSLKKKKNNG
jgi:hypothetical protein